MVLPWMKRQSEGRWHLLSHLVVDTTQGLLLPRVGSKISHEESRDSANLSRNGSLTPFPVHSRRWRWKKCVSQVSFQRRFASMAVFALVDKSGMTVISRHATAKEGSERRTLDVCVGYLVYPF
jgi:hypothetical protein